MVLGRKVLSVSEWAELQLPQQLDRADIKARLLRAARSASGEALQMRRGRIYASGLVGLVSTRDLAVQILPKVYGDSDPKRGLALLQNMLRLEAEVAGNFTSSPTSYVQDSLLEFMILLFANRLKRQLEHDFPRRYFERSEDLETIRGRVDLEKLGRVAPGARIRVPVTYSPLQRDNDLSRMIRALALVLKLKAKTWASRQALSECDLMLSDVTVRPLSHGLVSSAEPNGLEEEWRWIYDLALRFTEGLRADPLAPGSSDQFAILFSLHGLFERAVRRAFSNMPVDDLRLSRSKSIGYLLQHMPATEGALNLQPDLVFEKHNKIHVVGDAKWRRLSDKNIARSDAYQMASYVWHSDAKSGVLFYPSEEPLTNGATFKSYQFSTSRLPLCIVQIDIEKLCGEDKSDRSTLVATLQEYISKISA